MLRRVWHAFVRVRRGETLEPEDHHLQGSGPIARLARPIFRLVTRPWHMYPLGFLFGLGFDTATEIGLLGISAAQAAQGLSVWSILVFPALFTVGMTLVDTTDSVAMSGAYGWAFVNPLRKLWYNLTITAASVAVAFFIGGMEALGLLSEKLGLDGPFWGAIAALNEDLADFGFAVIGVFVATWLVSMLVYRLRGYRELEASTG